MTNATINMTEKEMGAALNQFFADNRINTLDTIYFIPMYQSFMYDGRDRATVVSEIESLAEYNRAAGYKHRALMLDRFAIWFMTRVN